MKYQNKISHLFLQGSDLLERERGGLEDASKKLGFVPKKLIEQQRSLWLSIINNLAKTDLDKKLLNLALLERASAGLNLDVLSIDQQKPIAEYLVSQTRRILKMLC